MRDLYKRRIDPKLQEFRFETFDGTYPHGNKYFFLTFD